MKKETRMIRINDEIRKETAEIIRTELKDPRIGAMTSVTRVSTTNDLSMSKIYVSVLGSAEQIAEVMQGLKSATGFIRKQIASRINLRITPELVFIHDDSVEHGIKMMQLIKEANKDSSDQER